MPASPLPFAERGEIEEELTVRFASAGKAWNVTSHERPRAALHGDAHNCHDGQEQQVGVNHETPEAKGLVGSGVRPLMCRVCF